MSERYIKSDFEELVSLQLQKNSTLKNLLRIMELENELLGKANEKLRSEIASLKKTQSKHTQKK